LGIDHQLQGDGVVLLVHQAPGHVTTEAVAGVVARRLGQRQLLRLSFELIATIPDSVRPRQKLLPAAAAGGLVCRKAVNDVPAADLQTSQGGTQLSDHRCTVLGADLVLAAGREDHDIAL
jgi:hypothetical protein